MLFPLACSEYHWLLTEHRLSGRSPSAEKQRYDCKRLLCVGNVQCLQIGDPATYACWSTSQPEKFGTYVHEWGRDSLVCLCARVCVLGDFYTNLESSLCQNPCTQSFSNATARPQSSMSDSHWPRPRRPIAPASGPSRDDSLQMPSNSTHFPTSQASSDDSSGAFANTKQRPARRANRKSSKYGFYFLFYFLFYPFSTFSRLLEYLPCSPGFYSQFLFLASILILPPVSWWPPMRPLYFQWPRLPDRRVERYAP